MPLNICSVPVSKVTNLFCLAFYLYITLRLKGSVHDYHYHLLAVTREAFESMHMITMTIMLKFNDKVTSSIILLNSVGSTQLLYLEELLECCQEYFWLLIHGCIYNIMVDSYWTYMYPWTNIIKTVLLVCLNIQFSGLLYMGNRGIANPENCMFRQTSTVLIIIIPKFVHGCMMSSNVHNHVRLCADCKCIDEQCGCNNNMCYCFDYHCTSYYYSSNIA